MLKLTRWHDGDPVWINPSNVEYVYKADKSVKIGFVSGDHQFVRETLEEVGRLWPQERN